MTDETERRLEAGLDRLTKELGVVYDDVLRQLPVGLVYEAFVKTRGAELFPGLKNLGAFSQFSRK